MISIKTEIFKIFQSLLVRNKSQFFSRRFSTFEYNFLGMKINFMGIYDKASLISDNFIYL